VKPLKKVLLSILLFAAFLGCREKEHNANEDNAEQTAAEVNNTFRIYGTYERGWRAALAEFNPLTFVAKLTTKIVTNLQ
jgi:hypothetical protein